MNNNYFPNTPNQQAPPTGGQNNILPIEQSYIENILRLNRGKKARFYYTFPDSVEWRDKIFEGIIETAGRDHIIISNPDDGTRDLLLMIYLDYVEFDGEIIYSPEFNLGARK